MQVTNEIRHAFLQTMLAGENPKNRQTVKSYLAIAFDAKETDELMSWLTLFEKVEFGKTLLQLCPEGFERTLETDLTEDR